MEEDQNKISDQYYHNSRHLGWKLFFMPTLFLIFIHSPLFSQNENSPAYNFNEICARAYTDIFNLKTAEAKSLLQSEHRNDPQNMIPLYLLHYCSMVELIVTEDENRYEGFKDEYENLRKIMDASGEDSPWYGFLEASMKFHLGLAYLKFGTKVTGAAKIYSAYGISKANTREYPSFYWNDELAGVFNVVFSYIPSSVRWLARLFGMRGNKAVGIQQLKSYYGQVKNIPGFGDEALLFLNFAYKYTWDEKTGLKLFAEAPESLQQSLLVKYFYASACSFTFRNDKAIELMDSIRAKGTEIPFYGLDYLYGRCKLNHLDKDANIYLASFLANYPGSDYKKDICNRLSYYYLLHNDIDKYNKYREMIGTIGSDLRDRDREAILESHWTYTPDTSLLKARFLFDGGYFTRAMDALVSMPESRLGFLPYKLEYLYRKGRILQQTKDLEPAIYNLSEAVRLGQGEPYTFPTLAAYQLGRIYENSGNYDQAAEWFDTCLEMYDSDHTVDSIEGQAEKGLERVEDKME